jgi:hypothetical protein
VVFDESVNLERNARRTRSSQRAMTRFGRMESQSVVIERMPWIAITAISTRDGSDQNYGGSITYEPGQIVDISTITRMGSLRSAPGVSSHCL